MVQSHTHTHTHTHTQEEIKVVCSCNVTVQRQRSEAPLVFVLLCYVDGLLLPVSMVTSGSVAMVLSVYSSFFS